ncbi:MAG TPA: hypothetical protein VF556_17745, partial [Pyrinomonadaceae bacterium]
MNSLKCPSCGLVNFAGETNCKRCHSDLSVTTPAVHVPAQIVHSPSYPIFNAPVQALVKCPFCSSTAGVRVVNQTTTGGIILFIVLLL